MPLAMFAFLTMLGCLAHSDTCPAKWRWLLCLCWYWCHHYHHCHSRGQALLFKSMSICLAHTFRWPNLHFFWWPMFSQNMLIWTINTIFDTKNIILGAESVFWVQRWDQNFGWKLQRVLHWGYLTFRICGPVSVEFILQFVSGLWDEKNMHLYC